MRSIVLHSTMIKGVRNIQRVGDLKTLLKGIIKRHTCNGTGIAKIRLRCRVCGGHGFVRGI